MWKDITKIKNAQLLHASELAKDAVTHGYSDDGYDYLTSSLQLAHDLVEIDYDQDEMAFNELWNEHLNHFACDGICDLIWEMKPPALKDDD